MEDRDDYPIIPQPDGSEQPISDKEPYFHLSKNEHGKMWLMYRPEGNGRYKCWEPITSEFWNEFEKLLSLEKELASLKEVVKELIPIAEHATRSLIFKPHIHNQYDEVIDRAKRISDNK